MDAFDEILAACREYSKDYLFIVSLGVTAKFLVEKLLKDGYRALDMGNLDMEYEWFLQNALYTKPPLEKHLLLNAEANKKAGYTDYLAQIKKVVGIPDFWERQSL